MFIAQQNYVFMTKYLFTLLLFCGAFNSFGQVKPTSATQGGVTGGAAAVTSNKPANLPTYSMKDINRLHGPYANGNVDAQSDKIQITYNEPVPSELDFIGEIIFVTDLVMELDGQEMKTGTSMQLKITLAPSNQSNPKELYVITQPGTSNEWILKEDPFNPK